MPKDSYFAVQTIYYPGFTIGGMFGEFGAIVATLALLFVTPIESGAFWLTCGTLGALLLMQGVFWLLVQPVNKAWLKG